jgi:hypothetical protein
MPMPRNRPPANAAARIEELAATGWSVVGIARVLGTTQPVLSRWLSESAALAEAFARGRERERYALHNKVFRAAMDGNVVAAFFLLKCRHGYREGAEVEHVHDVRLSFTLPAPAADVAEYRKLIDVAGVTPQSLAAPPAERARER